MADQTINVQIPFSMNYTDPSGNVIVYSDALYYPLATYQSMTQTQIQADETTRFNAWVAAITSNPTPPPAPPQAFTVFSKYAFLSLFSQAELAGISTYQSNTALNAQQQSAIAAFLLMFQSSDSIDTQDPNLVAGINFLVSCGLLASARATAILATTTTTDYSD